MLLATSPWKRRSPSPITVATSQSNRLSMAVWQLLELARKRRRTSCVMG
ncbi:hypothetical protein FOPG_19886 [Fusarium oxysporum f. sp. conglutinans race 2 54008]|uniref:Uncharacterized protein n=1 Tax=Fusarium oxysporum f. sp. conglutinans race 2 54008 TaxID=1089457 RepID=X0GJP8_FUSOX|nr:hypothetical protein FOPG_19886 [Fusarium oxysporum f. sp. conglutinans race 2 54008]